MQGDLRKTVYKMIRIVYNTHVAMKSGLKEHSTNTTYLTFFQGYTPYRDEKRTESCSKSRNRSVSIRSYTPYRDEKRTESLQLLVMVQPQQGQASTFSVLHSLPR